MSSPTAFRYPSELALARSHSRYYTILEEDVLRTGRYVEFDKDNWNAYSLEYTRLLLACGSEVDVVAKLLCSIIDASKKPQKINQYRDVIWAWDNRFTLAEVGIYEMRKGERPHRAAMVEVPWKEWGNVPQSSPQWWTYYNKVKHNRVKYAKHATLGNVLLSLAGLRVMLTFCYIAMNCGTYSEANEGMLARVSYKWYGDNNYNTQRL